MNKKPVDLLIKNALIVTVDGNDTIIPNGTLIIENGAISDIGTNDLDEQYDPAQTIDAHGNVVMPGLINSHTHIPMTMFRGLADDMPLQKWLNEYIFPSEAKHLNAENVLIGAELAIYEMIRFGTTCFADMYYFQNHVSELCGRIGIRCLLSEGILDFPVPNNPSPQHALNLTEELICKYRRNNLINIAVGPHSPYTCSEPWLIKARELANKYDVPFHIHLSETSFEQQQSRGKHGMSPLQHLDSIGCIDGKTIAAHCVHFDRQDIELMVRKKLSAVNNPQSNLKLVSGAAPVQAMLTAGGNVALGTDGAVSNNSLNMFTEMKMAALIHKHQTTDPTAGNARDIIRMATINGAKALALDHLTGSLEIGKRADIIIIDTDQPHAQPLYNVYSQIVYSLCGHDVDTVLIDGKIKLQDKKFVFGEFASIKYKMASLSAQIAGNFIS